MKKFFSSRRRRLIQYTGLSAIAMATSPRWLFAENGRGAIGFDPDVEIELKAAVTKVPILPGGQTEVWTFSGRLLKGPGGTLQASSDSYLGPTLRLRKGQKVRVRFDNNVPGDCIVHWHGLHVPEAADGHPRYAIAQGGAYVYEFEVKNPAGTCWYHSHTHGVTGHRIYQGLAGVLLVSDEHEEALNLPSGDRDIPLVIQDRRFDSDNQLVYIHGMHDRMTGFLGDKILVNGTPDYVLPVATRAYRLRVLNLSNSRIYKLAWDDGTPLTVIGTDGNLLERPEPRQHVVLGPSERMDLWMDFSGRKLGSELVMRSVPFTGTMPMMGGGMMGGRGHGRGGHGMHGRHHGEHGRHMGGSDAALANGGDYPVFKVQVVREERERDSLPQRLCTMTKYRAADAINADDPRVIRLSMRPHSPRLNGRSFAMNAAASDETVKLNNMYLLQFTNSDHRARGMMMAHAMHMHGQQFQVVKREIAPGYEDNYASVREGFVDDGWKDTVLVMPGEAVTLLKRFDDYEGLYLYHCHNLEHEDLDMMRNFRVQA